MTGKVVAQALDRISAAVDDAMAGRPVDDVLGEIGLLVDAARSAPDDVRRCVSCGCTDDRGCGEDGCAWATLSPPLCTACVPAVVGPHPPDSPKPETPDLPGEVSPAGIALGRYVVGPMIAGAAFGLGIIGIYGLIDLVHAWLG